MVISLIVFLALIIATIILYAMNFKSGNNSKYSKKEDKDITMLPTRCPNCGGSIKDGKCEFCKAKIYK